MSALLRRSFFAVAVLAVFGGVLPAADFVWSLNATTGNMATAANWDPAVTPPAADPTTNLTFLGLGTPSTVTATTITNDLAANFNVNQMAFLSGLSGGMTITSTGVNTFLFNGASAEMQQGGLGAVTFNAAAAINLGANTRIGGVSGAASAFGLGAMTYAGAIAIGGNTLTIGNGAAGNAPLHSTRIVSFTGANTYTAGGNLVLDGGNFSVGGATTNNTNLGQAGGTFTVTANGGTLRGGATITSFTAASIQLNGPLTYLAGSALTLGAGTLVNGAGDFTIRGATAFTVQSASNAYTGAVGGGISRLPEVTTAPGAFTFSGSAGSMTGAAAFNFDTAGTLALSSNVVGSVVNNDRIGDSTPLNLRGSFLSLTGSVTAATVNTENAGPINGAGMVTITVATGTGVAFTSLQPDSLNRVERGTFLIRGLNIGTAASPTNVGNVTFDVTPAGAVGTGDPAVSPGTTNLAILPYATADNSISGTGASWAVNGANGIRVLNTTTEYVVGSLGVADSNVTLATSVANNAAVTVNSLRFTTGGAITGTGTITVASGGILFINATTSIANALSFGSTEANVFANAASATISGNMTGSGGFTKSGQGQLILSGDNTGLTGPLTINRSVISFAAVNNLPGTGTIIVNGAVGINGSTTNVALLYSGTTAANLTRDIAINSGWLSYVPPAAAGVLTFSGNISGPGGMFLGAASANSYIFSGNNSGWSGPICVNEGTLIFTSDSNLGTGPIDLFTAGTAEGLRSLGNWTTSRHINFRNVNSMDTQANAVVWNGPVTGVGQINKIGSGSLTINAPGTNTGTMTIVAGSVAFGQNGALMTPTFTLSSGTQLILDNTTAPASTATFGGRTFANRVNDASTITLNTATLRSVGNGSTSLAERLGNVAAASGSNVLQVETAGGMANELFVFNLTATSGSMLVRGNALGAVSGNAARVFLTQFNGAAVSNGQILTNVSAEDLNNLGVIESGVYDAIRGIRLLDPALDFINGVAIQNGAPTNLPTTANFRVNPVIVNPVPVLDAANTINALRFAPNGTVDYTAATDSVLTITSGSLFTEATGTAAITQGGAGILTITAGAAALSVTANANLAVAASIGGTGGVAKSGAGTLTLTGGFNNPGAFNLNGGALIANPALTVAAFNGGVGTTATLNAPLLINGGVSSTINSAITSASPIDFTPTAVVQLIMNGNNIGLSGPLTAGPNGRLLVNNPNGFGSGPVTLNSSAISTFTTPLIGFCLPTATSGTWSNNIALPATAAILNFFIASTANGGGTNQFITLSGVLSGGNATSTLVIDETATANNNVIFLTNPNNSFVGNIRVDFGTLGINSDGALGNAANVLTIQSAGVFGGLLLNNNNINVQHAVAVGTTATSINNNGNTGIISGVLSGSIGLSSTGIGMLKLNNPANTYTGTLTVNAGAVQINGSFTSATGGFVVNTGATLEGVGDPVKPITVNANGTFAAGQSGSPWAGTMSHTGTVTFNGTARYGVGIADGSLPSNGTAGSSTVGGTPNPTSNNFLLKPAGAVTLSPTMVFTVDATGTTFSNFYSSYSYTVGQLVGVDTTLLTFTADANFAFVGVAAEPGQSSISGDAGGFIYLTFTPIPEPTLLAGLAALGLLVIRRRGSC